MTAEIHFDPAHRDAIAAKMNLSVLQRADPAVKRVLKLASHVCLYQLQDNHAWRRLDIEGSLFVVQLHVNHPNNTAHARHRIVIINRKSLQNYSDDVVLGNKDIELNNQMIMYNNSKHHTIGIWFYQGHEACALFELLQQLVNAQQPSQPDSPPSQTATDAPPSVALQSSPPDSAAPPVDQSPPRSKRAHKRVPRPSNINSQNPRPHKSTPQSVPDNSLERFFPGLKHTNGVAGGVLPPDVKTSSLLESAAVDALTSNAPLHKAAPTEFRPTAEIDEAIVIASDNAIPDAVLSTSPPASNHFPSQSVSILRSSKAEKKPRADPRPKSSPKSRTNTPLKAQRLRKANPAPKPMFTDSNAQQSDNTSAFYSQPRHPQSVPDHSVQSSPPSRNTSADRRAHASHEKSQPTPKREIKKTTPADVNPAVHDTKPAMKHKSPKQLEVSRRSSPPQTVKSSTNPTSRPKAQSPPQSGPEYSGTDGDRESSENQRLHTAASTALPSASSSSRTMQDLQQQLQSMPMPIDALNMQDPLLRTMVPPFRFPSGGDLPPLAHTAAMMPSPIPPPPPPPAPFPPGMHPHMALLMQQHQLFLQQQYLAQQHQRHMQMQSMPLPTMPMAPKSEARNVGSLPNDDAKSHSTKATDSAAELMRLLNVGSSDAEQQNKPSPIVLTDEEKGKHVAQSVAAADRKGELATSSTAKMDRSEFRAVVLRMLADKRLFETVYASYMSSKDE